MQDTQTNNSDYKYGFAKPDTSVFRTPKGLTRETIKAISHYKNEPAWMLDFRLRAYDHYEARPMPMWGANLGTIKLDEITYYSNPTEKKANVWADIPQAIQDTYTAIGIPEAEKKFLAGVELQYDSQVIYGSLKKQWEEQGVIFTDTDTALKKYPDLFKRYFGKIIPYTDNKLAALNSAVWSGGSFIYVPPNVHVKIPLQAYFRINAAQMGQFERTLIIADEGSYVSYIEGCSAPIYSKDSLHSAVVEIVVGKGARVRYTTIQNWSSNVYNLVTKRMFVEEEGHGEWVDTNLGCLQSGSTLTTIKGIKKIEDVEIGEKILSYDEATQQLCFKKVIAKRFSGMRKVHKVSCGQRVLYSTSNHPFYSYSYNKETPKKSKRYEFSYVRTDEINQVILPSETIDYGQKYSLIQPKQETSFRTKNQYQKELIVKRKIKSFYNFPKESNNDLMWLFGLFIGDGSIDKKNGINKDVVRYAMLGFSVPIKDRAYEKLTKIMFSLAPTIKPNIRKDGIFSRWCSKQLVEFFEKNGFTTGSLEKNVPDWLYSLPESQRLAFIAGCLDSDGTLTIRNRELSIKSINKRILEQTAKLLTTLGIFCSIREEKGKRVKILQNESFGKDIFTLCFRVDKRLLKYLTNHFSEKYKLMTSKRSVHFKKIKDSSLIIPSFLEVRDVKVSSLTQINVPTWDIEVEDTSNFISEGFLVHNSQITMKYPSCYLRGKGAKGEVLSLAYADKGQYQDTGGKMFHLAPYTSSSIVSKSVSLNGGRTAYRGMVRADKGAYGSKSFVRCDALLLDDISRADTYPTNIIHEEDVSMGHEASVSKIGEEQLFYLRSRGLTEEQATSLIVNGFAEPIIKELPLEYAVEMNRLIALSMKGSVG